MPKNAAKDAARKARRDARLGEDAVCVMCGFSNRDALVQTKRSIVEEHHVLGRQYDAQLTVPLCANCHRMVTEDVRRSGATMQPPPTFPERLVSMLRSVGTLLMNLGQWLLTTADDIVRYMLGGGSDDNTSPDLEGTT